MKRLRMRLMLFQMRSLVLLSKYIENLGRVCLNPLMKSVYAMSLV